MLMVLMLLMLRTHTHTHTDVYLQGPGSGSSSHWPGSWLGWGRTGPVGRGPEPARSSSPRTRPSCATRREDALPETTSNDERKRESYSVILPSNVRVTERTASRSRPSSPCAARVRCPAAAVNQTRRGQSHARGRGYRRTKRGRKKE